KIDQRYVACFLKENAKYPISNRAGFEQRLAQLLSADPNIDSASHLLAPDVKLSVPQTKRLIEAWLFWCRIDFDRPNLSYWQKEALQKSDLKRLHDALLDLVDDTQRATVVVRAASIVLTEAFGCSVNDFDALIGGGDTTVRAGLDALSVSECTSWVARLNKK